MPVVNLAVYGQIAVTDAAGAPVTGLVSAGFATRIAYLLSSPATSAVVSLTEHPTIAGTYAASFTPTVVGWWGGRIVYDPAGLDRVFCLDPVEVVTAAQGDPVAAIARLTQRVG